MATVTSTKSGDLSDVVGEVWDGDHHVPVAGDIVVIATGHVIAWAIGDGVRFPASSGTLASLTIQGTGQLAVTLSDTDAFVLDAAAITGNGVAAGSISLAGAAAGSSLSINNNGGACTLVHGSSANYFIYHNSTGTLNIIGNLTAKGWSIRNNGAGAINFTGDITGGTGAVSYGISQGGGGTGAIVITGTLTGGTGGPAVYRYSSSTGTITLNNCNLIAGAGSLAYGGAPPIWNNPTNAQYAEFAVAGTKYVVAPAQGKVLLDTVIYTGYNGTRVDCPAANALYTGTPYFGDPDSLVDGTLTLPNDGSPPYTADSSVVLTTGHYGNIGSLVQGTWVAAANADVRYGTANGEPPSEGTCGVPLASQVYLGITVDDTVGNLTLPNTGDPFTPDASLVKNTAHFGANNATAGTLDMSLYTLISGVVAAAAVLSAYSRYTGGDNGTYHEALVAEVQDGIMFGPDSAYEGEYVGEGGGCVRSPTGMTGGLAA